MAGRNPTPFRITKSLARHPATHLQSRRFSVYSRRQNAASDSKPDENNKAQESRNEPAEDGAMTRRLAEMTEQAMLEGGRSTRKNLSHAGFSEDLKKELEERVAAAAFKSDHAAAHSVVNMPESAGQGTRDIAGATPWTGTESTHDVTLRMLDSSKKPIKTPFKIPKPQPGPVDMRLSPKPPRHPGLRIADAKERTATYNLSRSEGVSETEREAMRREMRERFSPGSRPMPATLQGLASLANERIEDAVARGQFDKIKRGKGVNTQTDHNANSAFIDTTEYFMNKIIQKQEIVPPWIEKQQELKREVERFRSRLRADWRRKAAMLIASHGGSLEAQMKRARAYAAAEVRQAERSNIERAFTDAEASNASTAGGPEPSSETESLPHVDPLRDPQYIANERSFLELSIKTINSQTRSYNLQAPPVAQKPYLNLERELAACYADVAPDLAEEIKRRATERVRLPTSIGAKADSVFGSLSTAHTTRVYDEDQSKGYGFKQFWQDLFSKK
ncbi:hypothetical protein BDV18DRAFT_138330 [Aspergillus unguis]